MPEMRKSMYELWRDGELPEPYQSDIDGFSSEGKSQPERLFRAGFLCYKKLNEIMEARTELKIEPLKNC